MSDETIDTIYSTLVPVSTDHVPNPSDPISVPKLVAKHGRKPDSIEVKLRKEAERKSKKIKKYWTFFVFLLL